MTAAALPCPIFDFHARLLPRPGATEDLLTTMAGAGIAGAAVAAGGVVGLDVLSAQITYGGYSTATPANDAVLAACAASGGRLVPFYFANPHAGVRAYRAQVDAYRGLELSPAVHGLSFDDPRTRDYVAVASDAGHPVYVVCLGRPGTRPADLVALAARFPRTTFVFGHCGHTGIDIAGIDMIAARENVVAETSGCFGVVVRHALSRLGPRRVLFGTEYPLQHPAVELAKYASLDLSADDWRQVAWHNARRILREEYP
ncbi:amidohydrolase family protein [Luedemannella helvata]|uniref:Amidohydrolase-related domain-containing protein n=1 Tax=Luedemannella helvata TaxID=349315 RepID=A0ABN2JTF3_9ACTN